ncbi:hypothetical protein MU582_19735 [Nocardioidaceae bacterium SCSIO 66511]|nr:hypothetical protein MU582_19735 [Nocardioidaceae bacterium SCSIO 66511]
MGEERTRGTARRALPALLLAAMVLAGCFGSEPDESAVSEEIEQLTPIPRVQPSADAVRADRDPEAVTTALWRLDACRLVAGPDDPVERESPHMCRFGPRGVMRLVIGVRLEPADRYGLMPTNIAGAKAYVLPAKSIRGCTGWLPVSFTEAIEIDGAWDASDCGPVRTALRRTVKTIRNGSGRRIDTELGALDTCRLLRRGFDAEDGHLQYVYGSSSDEGIDTCRAVSSKAYATAAADPVTPWTATLRVHTGTEESLAVRGTHPRVDSPIDGHRIYRGEPYFPQACSLLWAESSTVLELQAQSCPNAQRAAQRVIEALDDPPDRSLEPQHRLLYGRNEPDHERRGDCVDYMPLIFGRKYQWDTDLPPGPMCHPYTDPDVPADAAEQVVAAESDPNVTCAIAVGAVREEVTDRLRPATLSPRNSSAGRTDPILITQNRPPLRARPCVFVDPERRIQAQVYVSTDPLPVSRHEATLIRNGTGTVHTGILGAYEAGYAVGLGDDPADSGYVAVLVGHRGRWSDRIPHGGQRKAARRIAETIAEQLS